VEIYSHAIKIVGITVKSSSSLTKMAGFFESFNMKEVKSLNDFDPEGIFVAHMLAIGYPSVFNRVQEISEGGDDNEDSHVKGKVATTLRKICPRGRNNHS
jgi:hypothetical protein